MKGRTRYAVVYRTTGQKNWTVETSDIQLLSTAVNEAKAIAKEYPKLKVQVWADHINTECVKEIQ